MTRLDQLSRRDFLKLSGEGLLAALLTACGGAKPPTSPATPDTTPTPTPELPQIPTALEARLIDANILLQNPELRAQMIKGLKNGEQVMALFAASTEAGQKINVGLYGSTFTSVEARAINLGLVWIVTKLNGQYYLKPSLTRNDDGESATAMQVVEFPRLDSDLTTREYVVNKAEEGLALFTVNPALTLTVHAATPAEAFWSIPGNELSVPILIDVEQAKKLEAMLGMVDNVFQRKDLTNMMIVEVDANKLELSSLPSATKQLTDAVDEKIAETKGKKLDQNKLSLFDLALQGRGVGKDGGLRGGNYLLVESGSFPTKVDGKDMAISHRLFFAEVVKPGAVAAKPGSYPPQNETWKFNVVELVPSVQVTKDITTISFGTNTTPVFLKFQIPTTGNRDVITTPTPFSTATPVPTTTPSVIVGEGSAQAVKTIHISSEILSNLPNAAGAIMSSEMVIGLAGVLPEVKKIPPQNIIYSDNYHLTEGSLEKSFSKIDASKFVLSGSGSDALKSAVIYNPLITTSGKERFYAALQKTTLLLTKTAVEELPDNRGHIAHFLYLHRQTQNNKAFAFRLSVPLEQVQITSGKIRPYTAGTLDLFPPEERLQSFKDSDFAPFSGGIFAKEYIMLLSPIKEGIPTRSTENPDSMVDTAYIDFVRKNSAKPGFVRFENNEQFLGQVLAAWRRAEQDYVDQNSEMDPTLVVKDLKEDWISSPRIPTLTFDKRIYVEPRKTKVV